MLATATSYRVQATQRQRTVRSRILATRSIGISLMYTSEDVAVGPADRRYSASRPCTSALSASDNCAGVALSLNDSCSAVVDRPRAGAADSAATISLRSAGCAAPAGAGAPAAAGAAALLDA